MICYPRMIPLIFDISEFDFPAFFLKESYKFVGCPKWLNGISPHQKGKQVTDSRAALLEEKRERREKCEIWNFVEHLFWEFYQLVRQPRGLGRGQLGVAVTPAIFARTKSANMAEFQFVAADRTINPVVGNHRVKFFHGFC